MSALSHPHICTIYDCGTDAGRHFLILEYLDRESLEDRSGAAPLQRDELLRHATQLAGGLSRGSATSGSTFRFTKLYHPGHTLP